MAVFGKLILGVLFAKKDLVEPALEEFSTTMNGVQRQSALHVFDETTYYQAEMCHGQQTTLWRKFISFSGMVSLEESIFWKKRSQAVENRFRLNNKRQINLDPGYVDLHKVVLLSAKEGGHKVYLGQNVWADMVLMKKKGGYESFPWTFPDLRSHQYDEWFLNVRTDFKKELKNLEKGNNE